MNTKVRFLLAASSLLVGCDIQPIDRDQPLVLEQGHGFAAVQLLTEEAQSQILFDPVDGKGSQLAILNVPAGNSLYILQAPAGRYCMSEYFYLGQRIFPHDTGCFSVPDGSLGFSGYLSPQVVDGEVFVEQAFREDDAEADLKREFPFIAARYPEASSFNIWVTTWIERDQGHKTKIYFHNGMSVPAGIKALRLYDCKNVKQDCKTYEMDINLAPHETKAVMEVEAADHSAAFSYAYEYNKP